MDTKTWLENYLKKPGSMFLRVVGIGMLLFGLLGLTGGVVVLGIWGVGSCALFCYMGAPRGTKEFRSWWSVQEDQGKAQQVLEDFRTAEDFVGGNLRLGQNLAYGKGVVLPCTYGEMSRVYQHIHKTNGGEDGRKLMVQTTNGQTRPLCDLPLRGKGDAELNRVLNALLRKNPNIKIGYQN